MVPASLLLFLCLQDKGEIGRGGRSKTAFSFPSINMSLCLSCADYFFTICGCAQQRAYLCLLRCYLVRAVPALVALLIDLFTSVFLSLHYILGSDHFIFLAYSRLPPLSIVCCCWCPQFMSACTFFMCLNSLVSRLPSLQFSRAKYRNGQFETHDCKLMKKMVMDIKTHYTIGCVYG